MYAWHTTDVQIFDVMRADDRGVIYGIAFRLHDKVHFKFSAEPTPLGVRVETVEHSGRRTVWTGATWNVLLEIAAAIIRA